MAKSPDAFRTISEVSDWLGTPAHVLRFWESKFSQIKPVKRAGGRRYYRPEDMALLAGIKTLLHDQGLTIKGAQKLLREKGVKYVSALGTDPREAEDAAGRIIDGEALEVGAASDTAPEAEFEPAPLPVTKIEPAAWDPDDPWPADPVPAVEKAGLAVEEAPPAPEPEPEPEPDAHPPGEVALPFVQARENAASRRLPAPPPLPYESAILPRPGVLAHLVAADRSRLVRQSARIAPLAARLRELGARIDANDR